jgi:tetraacyldisaccharide 4'-kinase
VISIGNLTVGGSGKTPHVASIAASLRDEGFRIAVLSRGYGRTSRGVRWVSDGHRILSTWEDGGDEPFLLARKLPGVPVVVGESRLEAGRDCLEKVDVDAFLLDDGFQHLQLGRDLDILLVDSANVLGNRLSLPFGPLREPPSHARFAHAMIVTKSTDAAKGIEVARRVPFSEGKPVSVTRYSCRSIVSVDGVERPLDPAGTPVAAFSALARNGQFEATLTKAGYDVKSFTGFRDHHRFTAGDIRAIIDKAGGLPVITTEKDLVKLPERQGARIEALAVDVEWLSGRDALMKLIKEAIGQGPT